MISLGFRLYKTVGFKIANEFFPWFERHKALERIR